MNKKIYLTLLALVVAIASNAQPAFTYDDMPNIGDNDSLGHIPTYIPTGNLDLETGNGYTWDFSTLNFNNPFWAVDSFRVKTNPVSAPFTDATIEYFHQEAAGNNLELYSYSNDTLYTHRTGPTTGGSAFVPPVASIKFPIAFGETSFLEEPIFTGATETGERTTSTLYDGFGTLQLPDGNTHTDVFRIRSIVQDSTYASSFTIVYTNYLWYVQGGDIPLLRISKIDFNGVEGTVYNAYTRTGFTATSIAENAASRLKIHPNPANDVLLVQEMDKPMPYSIMDAFGKTIFTGVAENNRPIDVKKLKSGLYFMVFEDNSTHRFIKN